MVEFDRTALFHTGGLGCGPVCAVLGSRGRCECVTSPLGIRRRRNRYLGTSALLLGWPGPVKCTSGIRTWTLTLTEQSSSSDCRCAKLSFGALDAVLRLGLLLLPVASATREEIRVRRRLVLVALCKVELPGCDGLQGCSHGCCHADVTWVALSALDPITRRQERVEPLDQVGMSGEKFGNSLDYSGGVDPGPEVR